MNDEKETSPGGSEIFRHEPPAEPPEPSVVPDAPVLEEVTAHVEAHVGPVENVFHEILSTHVHLDVLHVPPGDGHPAHVLVTCGMSALPMPGAPDPARAHAELYIVLHPDWPLAEEGLADDRNYWPVRLLKDLARLPFDFDSWLGWGHTIPNGDPPQPYADDTKLCGALLLPPLLLGEEFRTLERPGREATTFYSVWPLHADEMALKLEQGTDALLDAFDEAEVSEAIVKPDRPSAVAPPQGRKRRLPWRR